MNKNLISKQNPLIGQTIIYYPFKFSKSIFPKHKNMKIIAEKISSDKENNIFYDNFIKFVDTECNNKQNKFSRSIYTIGINKNLNYIDEELEKGIYCPKSNIENFKIDEFKDFIDLVLNRIKDNRKNSLNKIDSDFVNLNIPILSKVNIILYNKTNIGFLELYINYIFNNEDLVNSSKLISIDTGTLKKIFYLDNNKKDYKQRFKDDIQDKTIINNSLNIVSKFINGSPP